MVMKAVSVSGSCIVQGLSIGRATLTLLHCPGKYYWSFRNVTYIPKRKKDYGIPD
jgi:hypothetical protein